jgi:hypothetical protein
MLRISLVFVDTKFEQFVVGVADEILGTHTPNVGRLTCAYAVKCGKTGVSARLGRAEY